GLNPVPIPDAERHRSLKVVPVPGGVFVGRKAHILPAEEWFFCSFRSNGVAVGTSSKHKHAGFVARNCIAYLAEVKIHAPIGGYECCRRNDAMLAETDLCLVGVAWKDKTQPLLGNGSVEQRVEAVN